MPHLYDFILNFRKKSPPSFCNGTTYSEKLKKKWLQWQKDETKETAEIDIYVQHEQKQAQKHYAVKWFAKTT